MTEEEAIKTADAVVDFKEWELNSNARHRKAAVQPMVDELKSINGRLSDLFRAHQITNDLLAELIRRTGR